MRQKKPQAYFIGIKGVGMTALAQIYKALGWQVRGSDVKDKFFTNAVLGRLKIKFYEGFDKKNIPADTDLVIVSQAYLPQEFAGILLSKKPQSLIPARLALFASQPRSSLATHRQAELRLGHPARSASEAFFSQKMPASSQIKNPEVKEVFQRGLPILSYPQALAAIFNQCFGIAICGSHGKSTTTAMLGVVLQKAGLRPLVLVGSEVLNWKSNALVPRTLIGGRAFAGARTSAKPIFVIEADEYRGAFLNYYPDIAVLTNIDYDHPDYYKSEKTYQQVYEKFLKNLKGEKLLLTSEKLKIPKKIKRISVDYANKPYFPVRFEGEHYQKNAYLVYLVAKHLGIKEKTIFAGLKAYQGIKRRFEVLGTYKNVTLVDDYAHHPTELTAFYSSLKKRYPNRKIWFVFQPHTYTRTHFLFNEFKKTLATIPNLILLKTYPSAREKEFLKKNQKIKKDYDLYREIKKVNHSIYYRASVERASAFIFQQLQKQEDKVVVATVGAGNVWEVLRSLKEKLRLEI